MNASSLLMGSHTPPADWDGSPWWCDHCKQVVYTDPDHYLEIVIEYRALQKRASDGDKIAQARLRSRMSAHAAVHLDALLLAPMSIRVGTDFFIVDPMHAFELNVVKTAFKYSFGDRMDEEQRTDVAGYLDEIDLPLDIRVKGKRNPEQKWFTASAVDDFFLGCDEGARKVPALSDNILEIVQRVFPRPTDSPAEAPSCAWWGSEACCAHGRVQQCSKACCTTHQREQERTRERFYPPPRFQHRGAQTRRVCRRGPTNCGSVSAYTFRYTHT